MLLHRVPIAVTRDNKETGESVNLIVSFYRRSIDPGYQRMMAQKIDAGQFNEYIRMMLLNMLKSGKLYRLVLRAVLNFTFR